MEELSHTHFGRMTSPLVVVAGVVCCCFCCYSDFGERKRKVPFS